MFLGVAGALTLLKLLKLWCKSKLPRLLQNGTLTALANLILWRLWIGFGAISTWMLCQQTFPGRTFLACSEVLKYFDYSLHVNVIYSPSLAVSTMRKNLVSS